MSQVTVGIFTRSAACLALSAPRDKCREVRRLWRAVEKGAFEFDALAPILPIDDVGRPDKPDLVPPSEVRRRRLGSAEGKAALVHAIAHIEFNAINLALDAVCRFRDMPLQYYVDWLSVANDEARHYGWLAGRLGKLGFRYGDFPAHGGLWDMAVGTADDCLKRMALVPRVLEARGLDVTPGMIARVEEAGDTETGGILRAILREELRHVELGTHWFRVCCDQRGLEPERTFLDLLREHYGRLPAGPLNIDDRIRAGFTRRELDALGVR